MVILGGLYYYLDSKISSLQNSVKTLDNKIDRLIDNLDENFRDVEDNQSLHDRAIEYTEYNSRQLAGDNEDSIRNLASETYGNTNTIQWLESEVTDLIKGQNKIKDKLKSLASTTDILEDQVVCLFNDK